MNITEAPDKSRNEIIALCDNVVETNKAFFTDFNIRTDLAADAIIAGLVTPDTNGGLITDEWEALALGAFMSEGPWISRK